jgi:hypothetical protein
MGDGSEREHWKLCSVDHVQAEIGSRNVNCHDQVSSKCYPPANPLPRSRSITVW